MDKKTESLLIGYLEKSKGKLQVAEELLREKHLDRGTISNRIYPKQRIEVIGVRSRYQQVNFCPYCGYKVRVE